MLDTFSETAFSRARREFPNVFTSSLRAWLWVFVCGVASASAATHFSWGHARVATVVIGAAALIAGGGLATLFVFGALCVSAPVRQRDELRVERAGRLFPAHDLTVTRPWYWHDEQRGENYLILDFRFTNRETSARVNLRMDFVWVHRMSHQRNDLRHSAGHYFGEPLNRKQLIEPLEIDPMRTADGYLVFRADEPFLTVTDSVEFYVRDRIDIELEIEDYVSGATLVVPIETPRAPHREDTDAVPVESSVEG